MTIKLIKTSIPGCYEINPPIFTDERGIFVKTFHQEVFAAHGLVSEFAEEYYSVSRRGVLRGLHFQVPPRDHTKVVYCVAGEVFDAVVDLRIGSPAYGRFETFKLSAERANMIYIPPGLAHGFYVLSQTATIIYNVSTVYSPEHDTGIRWDTVGIPWPDSSPVISGKDGGLSSFSDFVSPFVYQGSDNV